MKALFKLKHLLYGSDLKPALCMKLFDQLIKPICLYGAEIWGPSSLFISSPLENEGQLEKQCEKLMCEKLHISFAKFVLGVHKKSQNSAVRGELGRPPLGLSIVSYSLKYLTRLELSGGDSLLKHAIETSKSIKLKKTWAASSQNMKKFVLTHSTLNEITIMKKKC